MSRLRTGNLLGAVAGEVVGRLHRDGRTHHSETSSSVAALNVIGFGEGCTNGALSRALGLSHTATVRLVAKLQATGLVESRKSADRRAVALYLTEAGAERAWTAVHERCLLLGGVVDALSEAQRGQLDGILETLLRSMADGRSTAGHICRLCDGSSCPQDRCPVHMQELAMQVA